MPLELIEPPETGEIEFEEKGWIDIADDVEADRDLIEESEIDILDWPADAIVFSTWLINEQWEPGTPLSYASAPTVGQRGQSWWQHPGLGPVALALGFTALGAEIAALVRNGLMGKFVALGLFCTLPALVLGTLGRSSQSGRRTATIGRLCAWAAPVPLLFILALALKSVADLAFIVLIVVVPLICYAAIAFLVMLVADAMLGTD